MKVRTKITLLLLAVIVAFLVGIVSLRTFERSRFTRLSREQFEARNRSFDSVLRRNEESLEVLAKYDGEWDAMVQAIEGSNTAWLARTVTKETLEAYVSDAAWIYRLDGQRVYSLGRDGPSPPVADPAPPAHFAQMFAGDAFPDFFVTTPGGVMHVRAAAVYASRDFRHEQPHGYIFVGRLWTPARLKELEWTGSSASVEMAGHRPAARVELDERTGSSVFLRELKGWDGRPVAHLVVRNTSPLVKQLNQLNELLLLLLFAFSLVLLLLVSTAVFRWVSQPLRHIMQSLSRNDLKPIERMAEEKSEFGELARTIHKFFEQSERLIREMEERRATEEALRKSEQELRHSQKMEAIGRLAGGVAHDFNNLLTAIIGYAELISGHRASDPQARQNAELILKAGEQAAKLTKQLLAFSRKQMMQPKVIDLNHLIVDMEKLLRRVIGERFELISKPLAHNGRVRADPSQVEQVILNLGVNARDAMPTGGKLTIETANVRVDEAQAREIGATLVPGEYVQLAVTDTGMGMNEETKSRIFEPFFTTKGPGKGTGLGLATVYGIVRQSGGAISVESEIGKGSTFRILLPRETAPVDRGKAADAPLDKSRNFETVLVVEDEDIVRELVCDVLSQQGYNVICAADGLEALRLSNDYEDRIHLMITDVIMPQMNGHELASKIAAERPDTKILYVSGYSDTDIGDHGVLDPRFELLQKPFTPQRLARKIRELLQEDGVPTVATMT